MKFKGNHPIQETAHSDPDQKQVRYPEPRKYPQDFQTLENANELENDEGDPSDGEGAVPSSPPQNNVLIFHQPGKPKTPPKYSI